MTRDIVERLKELDGDDHERLTCNARYAECSCGFNARVEAALAEAAAELSRLRGIVEEASRYAALGRACESNGLGWYGEDGTMLFQAPADVIEEQAIERLTPEQHRAFMHRKMGERMAASGDLGGDQSVSRATDGEGQ